MLEEVSGEIIESGQGKDKTKNLIVFDKYGDVCMMSTACSNSPYNTLIESTPDDYDVLGVDLETGKVAYIYKALASYQKEKSYNELMEKNKNYLAKEENKQLKATNEELNGEIKKSINRLEKSNVEIINYIDDLVNINEIADK